MPNPTKRALRNIASLAAKYSLAFADSKLANREVRIHTLYAGGAHLIRLLDSVDISFVQAGAKGDWLGILPAEALIQLLETESVHHASQIERK